MKLHADDILVAKIIAMAVRNAMEDFHVAHLADEQMRELNPIIRNAIVTALHAIRHMNKDKASAAYVRFQERLIPDYWEQPELNEEFLHLITWFTDNPNAKVDPFA